MEGCQALSLGESAIRLTTIVVFISSVLISSLETVWLHLVFAECIKTDIKHKSGRNDGSSRKLLISL